MSCWYGGEGILDFADIIIIIIIIIINIGEDIIARGKVLSLNCKVCGISWLRERRYFCLEGFYFMDLGNFNDVIITVSRVFW